MKKYLLTYKVISTYGCIYPKDYTVASEGNKLIVTSNEDVAVWWKKYKDRGEYGTPSIYELLDIELLNC